MRCLSCGFENPEGAKFCEECGTPFVRICPSCGQQIRPAAKFCPECGTALKSEGKPAPAKSRKRRGAPLARKAPRPPAPEAERRQLTVMFCDLVGSTALSVVLDPEELRPVIRAYQDACVETIQRFEGYVAKYLGDGLLVYFGYPQAHEDDAQRAIRAGLGIMAALPDLNNRLQQTVKVLGDFPLQVRIGIHTGLVVVGDMGGDRDPLEIVGETPNIAARVQGIAEPNTVVISAATSRLVQGLFECQARGPQALKGVSTLVPVYRVLRESEAQSRFEVAVSTGLTPFVGRAHEVELLQERWAQAKQGEGQVVLLSGEAGIGKSRLAQALKEQVSTEGAKRSEFRCSPYYQNSALYPIIEHLQRLLQFQREETPQAKLTKLQQALSAYSFPQANTLPLLASLLSLPHPEGAPPITVSPQKQKQNTQEALVAWMVEDAEKRAVYNVWEDLHWADPSTLELLQLYLDQIPTSQVLAVLTFRPEFVLPWRLGSHITQLTLSRLGRQQVEVMVKHVADGKALPRVVLQQIITKADGVPLFVEELSKMVLESGLLTEREGHYELTESLSPLAIPTTLHDSLTARLDRLAAPVKEIAQLGATLGREFPYELIRVVSPLAEPVLKKGLRQLIDAELLYQRGPPPQANYIFKHAMVQDAAYLSLLKSRRQQLHQQVAQVLEKRFPETSATEPELLAHHYAAANQKLNALPYAQEAAMRALQRSANFEAIGHARQAMNWLDVLEDEKERARVELTLNGIVMPALMASEAQGYASPALEVTARRSLELVDVLGEDPHVFPTLWALSAYHHVRSDRAEARRLAQRHLDLADRTNDREKLAVALPVLAQCLVADGDFTEAKELLEHVVKLYEDTRHQGQALVYGMDFLAYSYMTFSQVSWAMGYPDKALEQAQLGVAHARKLNHANTIGLALLYLMMNYQQRHERDKVIEVGRDMDAVCEKYGLPFNQSLGALIRNWALGETEASYRILAANQASKMLLGMTYYRSLVAESEAAKGHYSQALALVDQCLQDVERTEERYFLSPLHCLKGAFLLQQDSGAEEVAEDCFKYALEVAQGQKAKMHVLSATIGLCKVWQRRNQLKDARAMLTKIYNEFSEGFTSPPLIEAQSLLGQLG